MRLIYLYKKNFVPLTLCKYIKKCLIILKIILIENTFFCRSQRVGIIGAIMLTKHIVLVSSNEDSVPLDKSSEDNIVLSKKAKEAYSLIGDYFKNFSLLNYLNINFML